LRSRRIVTGCLLAVEGGLQPGHITNRMIVIGVGERGRFTRHAPPRRRALRSIHVAPQLNQSGLNLVMVVRVPFSTNNRISRKLSVPLSHKNSYPRLLSSSPGRRLSFPRTSSGTVNELDEVSVIANDEADLNLSADGEHVALPQVQLSSALVHGRNIGDSNLDALDGSVNRSTGEVTSETNNIRSPSLVNGVRLQNRATENRPNRPVIVASIRKERIRTRAGVLRQTHSALKLRRNQPMRKITVSDRNCLKRCGKV